MLKKIPGRLDSTNVAAINCTIESNAPTRLVRFTRPCVITGVSRGSFRCCPCKKTNQAKSAFQEIRQRTRARENGCPAEKAAATVRDFFFKVAIHRRRSGNMPSDCCLKSVSPSPWQTARSMCASAARISTAIPKMERGGRAGGGGEGG